MGGWFVGIVTVNQLVDVKVVTYINNLSELINYVVTTYILLP